MRQAAVALTAAFAAAGHRHPAPCRRHSLIIALLTVATTTLLAALGGCGSSASPGINADPATVVPAAAPLYIGAIVQPSGALESATATDGQKLTGSSEPFSGLLKMLTPSGSAQLNYAHDVKPWLGDQAGAFALSIDGSSATQALLSSLSEEITGNSPTALGEETVHALLDSGSTQGAIVLDTSDTTKARSFLQARAAEAHAHATSYRGVSYEVGADGIAEGMVGDFAVIGSVAALRAVIETEQAGTGSSLTHAGGYAKLAAGAEGSALANLYLRSSALPELGGLLGGTEQAYISLLPSAGALALNIDTIPATHSTSATQAQTQAGLIPNANAARAAASLPGNSWLALGIGDVRATFAGSSTPSLLRSLAMLGAKVKLGTYSLEGLLAPLAAANVNLQGELLSWMSTAGVFASGSGLLSLEAGIVATSTDPARSRSAVGWLAQLYRQAGAEVSSASIAGAETAVTIRIAGFPAVVAIGAGQGRFAIGLGPASVQEALSPASTLSTSAAYQAAATTLGHGLQPSVLIEFPTLVTLIETLGLNQTAGISAAFPTLQSLRTLMAGGGEPLGNGVTRARVVLGLQ
jgi:hypothetical protein